MNIVSAASRLALARACVAAAVGIAAGALPAARATAAEKTSAFESHWQDGKAELNGYRLTITRYGEQRKGTALLIFVTEPFSTSKSVKLDHPEKAHGDTFEALKLNFVRDFQTGIYDYNTMVSVFVRSRDISPVKTTFSSAEWCGHVYEELLYEPRHIADRTSSYFENESRTQRIRRFEDEIAEDNLHVVLRGLRKDYLKPGERRRVHFLPGTFYRRLTHTPLAWTSALIERSRGTESVSVPAGRFESSVYTVRVDDGREGRIWIESAYPHRVVRWAWRPAAPSTGKGRALAEGTDSGELTGSARLPYWELNGPGDESQLKKLGLAGGSGRAASSASGGAGAAKARTR